MIRKSSKGDFRAFITSRQGDLVFKMKTIINEFKCTREIMGRAVDAAMKHRAMSTYFMAAIAAVASIFNLVMDLKSGEMERLGASALLIGIVVLFFFLQKRSEKAAKEAVPRICEEDGFVSRIELGADIKIYHDDVWEAFDWSDYRTYVKNKEFILILLKRNAFIPLRCDSFVQGSAEECVELLKARQKRGRLS